MTQEEITHQPPEHPLLPERTLVSEASDSSERQSEDQLVSDRAIGQSVPVIPQYQPNATVQGGPGGQDVTELPPFDEGMVSSGTENIQSKKDTVEIGRIDSMSEGHPNFRSFSSNAFEQDRCLVVPLAPAP